LFYGTYSKVTALHKAPREMPITATLSWFVTDLQSISVVQFSSQKADFASLFL